MGQLHIGTQTNSSEKTPTLRQYAKEVDSIAARHLVTIVFVPNKYPNWTLVCEGKFRCTIPESTELHGWFSDNYDKIVSDSTALFVHTDIDSARKGGFTLSIDTDENTVWEQFAWGLKGTVKERPRTKTRGTRRKTV